MEDLLKDWEKQYRHFEELKETEIRHIQSVKINAKALQLKYCIKALKKQLLIHSVVKSFVCNNCQSKEEKKLTTSTSQCLKCGNLQAN